MAKYAHVGGRLLLFISRLISDERLLCYHSISEDVIFAYQNLKNDFTIKNLHSLLKTCIFVEHDDIHPRESFLLYKFLIIECYTASGFKKHSCISQVVAKLQYLCRVTVLQEIANQKAK